MIIDIHCLANSRGIWNYMLYIKKGGNIFSECEKFDGQDFVIADTIKFSFCFVMNM